MCFSPSSLDVGLAVLHHERGDERLARPGAQEHDAVRGHALVEQLDLEAKKEGEGEIIKVEKNI